MTIISLVRHGLVHNPQQIYYGRLPGFVLAEEGRAQAVAAGRALAAEAVSIVYHSPLQRAAETAALIGDQLAVPVPQVASALLIEIDSPFDGTSAVEMARRDWNFYDNVDTQHESPQDILARVCAFFDQARAAHAGQHVVGVSHADPIAFAILWANGLLVSAGARKQLAVCGVPEGYPSPASISTFIFADDAAGTLLGFHYRCPYDRELEPGD